MSEVSQITVLFELLKRLGTEENVLKGFALVQTWFQALRAVYDIGVQLIDKGGDVVDEFGQVFDVATLVGEIEKTSPELAEMASRMLKQQEQNSGKRALPSTPHSLFFEYLGVLIDDPTPFLADSVEE